jgi:quercetin dioxygenase-like cupin family protein
MGNIMQPPFPLAEARSRSPEPQSPDNRVAYVPADTGQAYWVMGHLFTFLVTGAESGGSYFTVIVSAKPNEGPPPHVHHLEEEQFYVLDGELNFYIGDQIYHVRTGDFIHIPRETIHSFRNGPRPARLLATFSPAGIEGFFREVGEPAQARLAPPGVTEATIARLLAAEAGGWKAHHDTLPPSRST